MKILSTAFVLSIAGIMNLSAQSATGWANVPEPTAYAITARDGNSQVWQRTIYEISPDGKIVPHIHQYTELASGLNYKDLKGQWQESKEEITILPDGTAEAINGQHKAYFPSDIYNGEIKLVTPDGKVLQSQPLGLSYDDGSNTMMIAVLTNSIGVLVGSNQVVYPNAFMGINADLRYTYRKSGFEQDVILHEQPPAPEGLGLIVKTTKLEMLTEFFNPPPPVQIKGQLNKRNGLTDTTLQFGRMQIGHGKAFAIGDNNPRRQKASNNFPVYKSWMQIQGRNILIEELPYQQITTSLQTLPANVSAITAVSAMSPIGKLSKSSLLPLSRAYAKNINYIQSSKMDSLLKKGMVLDYVIISFGETNFTFQGDKTYYFGGVYNLSGTTTFEGGTIIKMNGGGQINIGESGVINCLTDLYRPVVFTSYNDNSVGEEIGGSSGAPAFGDVSSYLFINSTNNCTFHDLRASYSWESIFDNSVISSHEIDIWDSQFLDVDEAIYGNSIGLHNVLIARSGLYDAAIYSYGPTTITLENVTADNGWAFIQVDESDSSIVTATNCLVTDQDFIAANSTTVFTNSTVWLQTLSIPVYQTVGGGSFYLTNGSLYHNAGTTNINPAVLADLAIKTTYPPIACTNVTFSTVQTFSPQAQRDNIGNPDLGYHYNPLDYTFGGCAANTNLTFTSGTAVGWFRSSSGWYHAGQGIEMNGSATVAFNGTATTPDYWVRLNTVQENDQTAGYGHGSIESWSSPPIPTVTGNFLHCTTMANEQFNGYFADDYGTIQASMVNSEFWNGSLMPYGDYITYTNCLLWRQAGVGVNNGTSSSVFIMRNCTMIGGSFTMNRNNSYGQGALPVSVRDCAFDGTLISTADTFGSNPSVTDYNYNAYTNSTDPFSLGGVNDVKGTSFNWQTSWFGNFYQTISSPLIDKGSTPASLVGLYHFTTQTNQASEANSQVDIGYHYVATDAYGNPLDTDGDGIPDYIEDANGNGVYDIGDLSNWLLNPYNGLGGSISLTVFTPLK